jgi:hypothetical protein
MHDGDQPRRSPRESVGYRTMRRFTLNLFSALAVLVIALAGRPVAGQEAKKEDAQVAAMVKWSEQRFGKQLRGLFKAELIFLKDVAAPTKEQLDKICAGGAPSIKNAIQQIALSRLGRGADPSLNPPRDMVRAIAQAAKELLSAEQFARYQKELDARAAARKRLTILNLVAMTDHVLRLRPDQRDKLTEVLTANWDPAWDQPRRFMYGGGQYFPRMPDAKILPLLTEPQKGVWENVPKGSVDFGWWLAGFEFLDVEIDGADAIIEAAINP